MGTRYHVSRLEALSTLQKSQALTEAQLWEVACHLRALNQREKAKQAEAAARRLQAQAAIALEYEPLPPSAPPDEPELRLGAAEDPPLSFVAPPSTFEPATGSGLPRWLIAVLVVALLVLPVLLVALGVVAGQLLLRHA